MLNLNFIYRAVFCCIILSVISCNAKDQGEESGIEKIDEFGIEQIGVAEALESKCAFIRF